MITTTITNLFLIRRRLILIGSIASHDYGAVMNTFSSCFKGYAFDEQPYMDAVNLHCGTTPCKVFPSGDRQLWDLRQGERYLPRILRRRTEGIRELLRPEWRKMTREVWRSGTRGNKSLKDYQRDDLLRWSLPVLLRYEDRNSMAHSFESRVPFVDHRFLVLCFQFPDNLFFTKGRAKRLLTDAMDTRLPACIHQRRDKYGFNTPVANWMQGMLGNVLQREIVHSSALGQYSGHDETDLILHALGHSAGKTIFDCLYRGLVAHIQRGPAAMTPICEHLEPEEVNPANYNNRFIAFICKTKQD